MGGVNLTVSLTVKYPVFLRLPLICKKYNHQNFSHLIFFFQTKSHWWPFCSGVQDASQTQKGKEIIQKIFILLTTNVSWNTFPLPLHCFVQQTWVWKKWKLFYSFLSILRLHDSRLRKLLRSDQLDWKSKVVLFHFSDENSLMSPRSNHCHSSLSLTHSVSLSVT